MRPGESDQFGIGERSALVWSTLPGHGTVTHWL
jgi:hypothetical protein